MKAYGNALERAGEIRQKLIEFRREFHKYPEMALHEFNTAEKVEKVLKELGIETKRLAGGTGVLGFLRGVKGDKKTIGLRADMDALPVEEESDVPYKSRKSGVMHACGHDAHTAMLLGAAMILAGCRNSLNGNVAFIFQPAEEIGKGARRMVEDGVLEGVDAVFGLHVLSSISAGRVGYRSGPLLAAGDFFDVKIIGKGGHGGLPHLAVDPIAITASVINSLQTIISREVDPLEGAVISICKLAAGGEAYNVIPDSSTFGGTIRCLNPELRDYLPKRIKEILDGVVLGMRGRYEFNLINTFPATINDEGMTLLAKNVAENVLGPDRVYEMKALMGSEDFAYYLQKVPGTFVFLGVGNEEKGIVYPQHHPKYDIDEDVLPLGSALHVGVALEYLSEE